MVSTFGDELDRFYKMSGVFVQMLLHDAEKQDATLDAEVSFMENYKALEEIKRIEEEKEEISLPSMVNKINNKVRIVLLTLQIMKIGSKLPTLLEKDEIKQLNSENEMLKKKIEDLKLKVN